MENWSTVATEEEIVKTVEALNANGINTVVVNNATDAKNKVLEMLPSGAEVMDMISATLENTGLTSEIRESGKYNSVHKALQTMDRATQGSQMQKMGAGPDWAIGSVHAVTMDGRVLMASNSGSQMPAYVYGANHVIWVVGSQKIVSDTNEGIKRIYEYCLPIESERAKKAYGVEGSNVNKLLLINRELKPDRIHMILVRESVGV
jgi:hypothetical protein